MQPRHVPAIRFANGERSWISFAGRHLTVESGTGTRYTRLAAPARIRRSARAGSSIIVNGRLRCEPPSTVQTTRCRQLPRRQALDGRRPLRAPRARMGGAQRDVLGVVTHSCRIRTLPRGWTSSLWITPLPVVVQTTSPARSRPFVSVAHLAVDDEGCDL